MKKILSMTLAAALALALCGCAAAVEEAPVWRMTESIEMTEEAQAVFDSAAEDLTDDVFLAALEHYGDYDPVQGSIHTWLSAIAHNRVVNYRASAHTRREISVWVIPERPDPGSGWQEQGEGIN